MWCTKSHVYVHKVSKCSAINHIYMLRGLLENMYVLSSVVGSWCDIMPISISHRGTRANAHADTNPLIYTHKYIYIHMYKYIHTYKYTLLI